MTYLAVGASVGNLLSRHFLREENIKYTGRLNHIDPL